MVLSKAEKTFILFLFIYLIENYGPFLVIDQHVFCNPIKNKTR